MSTAEQIQQCGSPGIHTSLGIPQMDILYAKVYAIGAVYPPPRPEQQLAIGKYGKVHREGGY
jgi:hypothetical protein